MILGTRLNKVKMSLSEKMGIAISLICILHCIAIPLVLVFFPMFFTDYLPDEDLTHVILLAFVLGVAGVAFLRGYLQHRQKEPFVWMAIGIVIIVIATYFSHDLLGHLWEPILAIIGSLFLIKAHLKNHQCKQCDEFHEQQHHAVECEQAHEPSFTLEKNHHHHTANCSHSHENPS